MPGDGGKLGNRRIDTDESPVTDRQVAVAATGRQALEAGLGVAAEGGNAVDAALAAAFVAMATEPGMVSFAGGCFVVGLAGRTASRSSSTATSRCRAAGCPEDRFGRGVREVVTTYGGGVTMHAGHGSVATPGIVPAFGVAHERYARLPWARLVAAGGGRGAARLPDEPRRRPLPRDHGRQPVRDRPRGARPGHPPRRLACSPAASRPATPPSPTSSTTSRPIGAGPVRRRRGRPRRSSTEMEHGGGLVTAEDLAAYQPVVRPAHVLDVGDWSIATNPPPVGRRADAGRDARRAGPPRRLDLGGRDRDPARRAVLPHVGARLLPRPRPGRPGPARRGRRARPRRRCRGSASTAHISAIDDEGTACAITMSSGYGAGLCIPGTGILLNNCLGETELNRHGLHAVPPGTRLASNMAPTTGRAADGRVAGDRLPRRRPDHHRADAGARPGLPAPRRPPARHLAARGCTCGSARTGFTAEYERDPDLAAAVEASGLPGHEYPEPHMYFGGVGAAQRDAGRAARGRRRRAPRGRRRRLLRPSDLSGTI